MGENNTRREYNKKENGTSNLEQEHDCAPNHIRVEAFRETPHRATRASESASQSQEQ